MSFAREVAQAVADWFGGVPGSDTTSLDPRTPTFWATLVLVGIFIVPTWIAAQVAEAFLS